MSKEDEFSRILADRLSPFGRLTPAQNSELWRHYELLLHWNRALNLTSVAGLAEVVVRHYCESLFLGIQLPGEGVSVLDVGSGAGFPGIPMAILRPDCRFTLAESHQRKAVFLREATRHFPNVAVAPCRAEDVHEAFDWIVSRAVRWPAVLDLAGSKHNSFAAAGKGLTLGLLVGHQDAGDVLRERAFDWQPPIPLPWGKRRVLVIGRRRSL
jgi:16S rRNA (guanine527-N7)-methyltransferase